MSSQGSFPPGSRFGTYQIVREIATGGQGKVLHARHADGTEVALKLLTYPSEAGIKRFQLEVGVLARLYHPNLPRILDSGEVDGRPYFAMQYLEGPTVHDRIERGDLPLEEALAIAGPIALALDYCHTFSVFHRDLKPKNVVLDQRSGRPYLVDFGILKRDTSDGSMSLADVSKLSLSGELIGTPEYMAPEQTGGAVDARTDVYGLAATVFCMLTGRPPFEARSAYHAILAVAEEPAPDPRTIRPELPVGVARALLKALEKSPDDRFQSAGEFVAALRQGAEAPDPPSGAGRALIGALLACGGLLTLAGAGAWLASSPPPRATPRASASATPSLSLVSASPSPSPEASPTLAPLRAGPPGSLHLRHDRFPLEGLSRVGPWLLARKQGQLLGFREGNLAAGAVFLAGEGRPAWDSREGALYRTKREAVVRVTETGATAAARPRAFAYVPLGPLTLAATQTQVVAFDPREPTRQAWALDLQALAAPPLVLDLDQDQVPDHALVCSLAGRIVLVDARGDVRVSGSLPGGVAAPPLLLSREGAEAEVILTTAHGLLLRCRVSPERLKKGSRLDLLTPITGGAVPLRRGRELLGFAVSTPRALIVARPDLSGAAWVGRYGRGDERGLSEPAVVDLDRDGTPEVAYARTSFRGGPSSVEVYDAEGRWIDELKAGPGDLRLAGGVSRQLVAAGSEGLSVWGPWEGLPRAPGGPSGLERLHAQLLGGAWTAAAEEVNRLAPSEGDPYRAMIAHHLGRPDRRGELTPAATRRIQDQIARRFGTPDPHFWQRLVGRGRTRLSPGNFTPLASIEHPPDDPGRRGFVLTDEGVQSYGIQDLRSAGYEPRRRVFAAGGGVSFELFLANNCRDVRLTFGQSVFSVGETGVAHLELRVDGDVRAEGTCIYDHYQRRSLSAGVLKSGTRRIELWIPRSSAVLKLHDVWLEGLR